MDFVELFSDKYLEEDSKTKNKALDKLFNKMKKDELILFLKQTFEYDNKLEHKFREYFEEITFEKNTGKLNVENLNKTIEKIVYRYAENYNYIDYNGAGEFLDEFESFVSTNLKKLLDRNLLEDAFDFATYSMSKLAPIQYDDYYYADFDIIQIFTDFFEGILENHSAKFKEKVISYFKTIVDKSNSEYVCNEIYELADDILFGLMDIADFYNFQIKSTIEVLSSESYNSFSEFNKSILIENLIELMENAGKKEDEILPYYLNNLEYENIRRKYIYKLFRTQKQDEAIHFIHRRMKIDFKNISSMKFYLYTLRDAYKKQDKDKYIEGLYTLAKEYNYDIFVIFNEFKALYKKEEWLRIRIEIIEKLKHHKDIDQIYFNEKMYDELLSWLEENPANINKYAKKFKSKYPEKVLEIYKKQVLKSAELTGNRKSYQELVQDLKFMLTIKNSKDTVKEIMLFFRSNYKNRR